MGGWGAQHSGWVNPREPVGGIFGTLDYYSSAAKTQESTMLRDFSVDRVLASVRKSSGKAWESVLMPAHSCLCNKA